MNSPKGNRSLHYDPIHFIPNSLQFSILTSKELLLLSVKNIYTHFTFDALEHPFAGGLYDTALGPFNNKCGPCQSCLQNIIDCPGHLGHIELPLPVVNPMFFHVIAHIMRLICVSCHTLQFPENIKSTFTLVLDLLDSGFISEAQELFQQLRIADEKVSKKNLKKDLENDINITAVSEGHNKYLMLLSGKLNKIEDEFSTKNVESLRISFISILFHVYSKVRKVCINCKEKQAKIKIHYGKIMKIEPERKDKQEGSALIANEPKMMMPNELKEIMQNLWKNEKDILCKLYPILSKVDIDIPTDIFFFDILPVTPPIVRPINLVRNTIVEHPQTSLYKSIIQNANYLRTIMHIGQNDNKLIKPNVTLELYNQLRGANAAEKMYFAWQDLQSNVNNLMTSEAKNVQNAIGQGIKEIIEKKQGIIRKHMMGKRVNFAARSVITPDPNLNIDEVGVPEEFAKRLTYPIPVTSWNVGEIQKLILNGPNVYPGAVVVEYEDGSLKQIPDNNKVQELIAKKILLAEDVETKQKFGGLKIVHRHLVNGDPLIMNRQPTLHKPSIMAHKARVLKGEKTLRLHYANCKAYNADFDGDEMNAHFPQNELARSEAYTIVNVPNQYLVPKDGTPLSGLIQDNMISGVCLSLRGRFFSKQDYQSLVYFALGHTSGHIHILPPAIIKPSQLWSGKQIISTVIINNIPKKTSLINLNSSSKIAAKVWQKMAPRKWIAGGSEFNKHSMCESEVIIKNGELLCGILDKTQYGATPYGLIHSVYELYGGNCSSNLLSSFSKLFTFFLQREGFTLGVQDILVTAKADNSRTEVVKKSRWVGPSILTEIVNVPINTEVSTVTSKIEEMYSMDPKFKAIIDRRYKSMMDEFTNTINKICLPAGLIAKFPDNNLQLMIQSGAKGSAVNAMQISCLLGQIELEGKRPPAMLSGRSLPSFPPFDSSPRAGGFIDGRFMTGIRPQEFFFHCMAGREGLIDTAVKTSRSGYLQRCLVKHLEGLNIAYDMTVRDSDNTIIQFLYGEDGMDVSKVQFINSDHIDFLANNAEAILKGTEKYFVETDNNKDLKEHAKSLKKWIKKYGDPIKKKKLEHYSNRHKIMCPDPVISKFQPDSCFGALSERLEILMKEYLTKSDNKKNFVKMLEFKASTSLCAPGEPVGLLAAQSIGEPSTQMTLNTFHFAGRGDMNVTLGIPRLKEMLMTASKHIKTPSMEIPFLTNVDGIEKKADQLRKKLTRVTVDELLEKVDVKIKFDFKSKRKQVYTLKFHFLPYKYYKSDFAVKPKTVLKYMEKHFFINMFEVLKKKAEISVSLVSMGEETKKKPSKNRDDEDDIENDVPNEDVQQKFSLSDQESGNESDIDDEAANKQINMSDEEDEEKEGAFIENEHDDDDIKANDKVTEDKFSIPDKEMQVISKLKIALNYTYDKKDMLWCELVFSLPIAFKQIDISAVVKEAAIKSVIWEVPQIRRAITYKNNKGELMLRTEGINIIEMFKYHKVLDLNRLYSNDIHGFAMTYGIEAAIQVMVKEMKDVFNVYGIVVDPRHLLLIADYMMFSGNYQPLSRKGMEDGVSPLQQMSFEGSLTFLKNALVKGKADDLKSPSSCLITGQPCRGGTGSFTLFHNFQNVC